MNSVVTDIEAVYANAELLYSAADVASAFDQMADAITTVLKQQNPLVLSVLTGGIIPTAELLSRLQMPLQLDYIHVSRYRGDTSGGALHWLAYPQAAIMGRVVLIIDDILDEGKTLEAIVSYCQEQGASKVYSAVLVQKNHDNTNHAVTIAADFVGLQVPDRYVFGCGMDYHDYLRNVPGIYAVKGL